MSLDPYLQCLLELVHPHAGVPHNRCRLLIYAWAVGAECVQHPLLPVLSPGCCAQARKATANQVWQLLRVHLALSVVLEGSYTAGGREEAGKVRAGSLSCMQHVMPVLHAACHAGAAYSMSAGAACSMSCQCCMVSKQLGPAVLQQTAAEPLTPLTLCACMCRWWDTVSHLPGLLGRAWVVGHC